MRIGYFDMGGSLAECPEPLECFAVNGKWYCRRTGAGCTSVYFSVLGKNHSLVCEGGMVKGYQYGSTDMALSICLHLKHQMTCTQTEYLSLMDPPHEAIITTQWDSMPIQTIIIHNFSALAQLCKGHPLLRQPSLEVIITVTPNFTKITLHVYM